MHPIRFVKQKLLNGLGNTVSDVGPLSFFSQWFNPNNMVGELEQLEQYKGIVYACISAIAEDVAKIEFTLNKKAADGTLVPVKGHPFLDLLKDPNPTQSDYEFMEMTQTHIELAGEAFWYVPKGAITSKPKELWLMRPDLVQIVYDAESGEVTGYVYHKWNGRVQIPLDLEEVVHFKMPNPINPYRGMGTVQAGIVYIQTEQYASEYSRNFLANGGTPSGIVNFKGTIPDPEFQKIKRQWQREYGGVANGGKTAFLRNADASYTKVGSNFTDIDLKELKNLTRDDIMFMFRVSKPILGITEDVNYASAKTAEYVFAKRVIDPKMSRLVNILQTFYNVKYKDKLIVSYESPIPQDNDEKIAYMTAAVKMPWMTPNEARAAEGMKPVEGGDSILVPFNVIPLASAAMIPDAASTEQSSTDTSTTIDNSDQAPDNSDSNQNEEDGNSSSNSGESGNGDNTDADTGMPAGDTGAKQLIKKRILIKFKEKANRPQTLQQAGKESYRLQLMKTADSYVPQIKDSVAHVVAGVQTKIMHQIKNTKKRDLSDDIEFDDEQTKMDFVAAITPILMALMRQAGSTGLELAGADSSATYTLSQISEERIAARIHRVMSDYTEELQQDVINAIKTGLKNGDTIATITKAIEKVGTDYQGWKAERLARTEAIHEANMAALDSYLQSGLTIRKEWLANPDACQYCRAMNGETMDLEEIYVPKGGTVLGVEGGEFLNQYDDIEAGDLHPNCRCTIIPIVSRE